MNRKGTRLIVFFVFVLVSLPSLALADHPSVGLGIGAAAPICTTSAIPLARGMWSLGVQTEFNEFDDFSDRTLKRLADKDPEAHVHSVDSLLSVVGGAAYGLTDDLSVGLRLPYVRRNNIREAGHHRDNEDGGLVGPSGRAASLDGHDAAEDQETVVARGDSEGLGDLTVYGQYRFYKDLEWKVHAAFLLGIKTPTGFTDEKDRFGERFETDMQPGSGSWDPMLGLALTKQWSRLSLDTNILYSFATEGDQDTNLGNVFVYNLALSYRLGTEPDGDDPDHHEHAHGHDHAAVHEHMVHPAVDLVLELNGEWRDRQEIGSETDDNTGGHTIYLSPGVRFTLANGLSASISAGLPVLTNLNGDQVEPEYRVLGSLSWCF